MRRGLSSSQTQGRDLVLSSRKKGNNPEQSPAADDAATEDQQPVETGDAGKPDAVEDAEFVDVTDAAESGRTEESEPEDAGMAAEPEPDSEDTLILGEAADDAAEPEEEPQEDYPAAEDAEPVSVAEAPESEEMMETAEPEEAAEPASEEPPAVEPAPQPAPEKSSGGFMPAVLGGLVAAGIGFGAATYIGGDDGSVSETLEAQSKQLGGLESRIGEIAAAVSDGAASGALESQLSGLTEQLQTQFGDVAARLEAVAGSVGNVESQLGASIGAVQEQLAEVDTRLAAVNDRLTAVEKRPLQESSEAAQAAFAAYERELEDLKVTLGEAQALNDQINSDMEARAAAAQAEMDEVSAQAEELQAAAAAKAEAAAAREAVATLDGALERGAGYATALAVLSGLTDIPEILTANAEDGVASLPELRRRYPEQARAALDASIRETVADDTVGRLEAFLLSQTGARSLAPREGDDPDAVLSRAEAALNAGDLETTLSELAQLPPAGQAAMADWVADAQTRLDATAAAAGLAETLLAN